MLNYKLIKKLVLFSVILFTYVFAGVSATIKNVNMNVNTCSDGVSPTEELCCTNNSYTWTNSSCADNVSQTEELCCTVNSGTWANNVCSSTSTLATWTNGICMHPPPNETNPVSPDPWTQATLEIYYTSFPSCSYCSDNASSTEKLCCTNNSGIWSNATCTSGTATWTSNDQNVSEEDCTTICMGSDNQPIENILSSIACDTAGGTWDANLTGLWHDGTLSGFQIELSYPGLYTPAGVIWNQGFNITKVSGPTGMFIAQGTSNALGYFFSSASLPATTTETKLLEISFSYNFTGAPICFVKPSQPLPNYSNVSKFVSGNGVDPDTDWGPCVCPDGEDIDQCSICDSNSSNDNTPSTGTCDCTGVIYDNTVTPTIGNAYIDNCNSCVGGSTGTCSDPQFGNQTSCENAAVCSDPQFANKTECLQAQETWEPTWTSPTACVQDCQGSCDCVDIVNNSTSATSPDNICDESNGTAVTGTCVGGSNNGSSCTGNIDCPGIWGGGGTIVGDECMLSIVNVSYNIPTEFIISQNYPNPFNPITSISFDVPKLDKISLIVYDLSGREIATLASGKFMPGKYIVNWNASNNYGNALASGMYLYRYISSDKTITRKMLYLK